jgi:hypothetical protein
MSGQEDNRIKVICTAGKVVHGFYVDPGSQAGFVCRPGWIIRPDWCPVCAEKRYAEFIQLFNECNCSDVECCGGCACFREAERTRAAVLSGLEQMTPEDLAAYRESLPAGGGELKREFYL